MRGLNQSVSFILLALAILLLSPPGAASAHAPDENLVLNAEEAGPYLVSVWTISNVGDQVRVHAAAAIFEPKKQLPVVAATVTFRFERLSGDPVTVSAIAHPALPTTGFLHESDLVLPGPGRYRVTVTVSDTEGTGGDLVYYLLVYPPSTWMRGSILLLLVLGLVGTIGLAAYRRGYSNSPYRLRPAGRAGPGDGFVQRGRPCVCKQLESVIFGYADARRSCCGDGVV